MTDNNTTAEEPRALTELQLARAFLAKATAPAVDPTVPALSEAQTAASLKWATTYALVSFAGSVKAIQITLGGRP